MINTKTAKLSEAMSDITYHYTTIHKALSILESGKINLTPTIRNDSEFELGSHRFYFLSLTRSRQGAYHRDNHSGVLFTLDGRKLSANYHAQAVDYWNTFKDHNGVSLKDEMEDRIFTNDAQLDILRYTKEISILVDSNPRINYVALKLYSLAKRKGIPVLMYNERKAWLLNDKRKALSIEQIKELELERTKPYHYRSRRRSRLLDLIELYHKSREKDLSNSARDMLGAFNYSDYLQSVSADLHNETGSNQAGASSSVRKLIGIMKQGGFKSFKDFMEYLKKKWDRIAKEEQKLELMKRNQHRYDAIIDALRNHRRVDLSVFSGHNDETKARMVFNTLWQMINYEIYIDEMQQFEPNFKPNDPRVANAVDVLTLRLTGIMV